MGVNRRFIILNQEESDFCERGATGYCKIEWNNNKAKIKVYVQALKALTTKKTYKAYLLSCDDSEFNMAYLGELESGKKSSELNIETSAQDVMSTGTNISKYNMAVIAVNDSESNNLYEFPLMGVYNIPKNDKWKSKFIKHADNKAFIKTEEKTSTDYNSIKNETIEEILNIKYFKNIELRKIEKTMNKINGVKEYNPFTQSKLKYKWWEITNIGFFEDILKSSVVSNQIFKHPLIKKMIKDSNHCMFGIASDMNDKIRYITYGFPAKYSMKEQIYVGGFSNFYPILGHTKANGAFGYWVVHIKLDADSITMTV